MGLYTYEVTAELKLNGRTLCQTSTHGTYEAAKAKIHDLRELCHTLKRVTLVRIDKDGTRELRETTDNVKPIRKRPQ